MTEVSSITSSPLVLLPPFAPLGLLEPSVPCAVQGQTPAAWSSGTMAQGWEDSGTVNGLAVW